MQRFVHSILSVFFIVFAVFNSSFAQVSSGGSPMQLPNLKSSKGHSISLPAMEQSRIDRTMKENNSEDGKLKAFRFALPYKVELSTANAGEWFLSQNGYNVWRLTIHAENAKSLIVMFNRFKLQKGTRLFLFNEKEEYYLGAFTDRNNKTSGKFAVSPVLGEQVTIQYEVPAGLGKPDDFLITNINYDFVGVLKTVRRPLGETAGVCNVDVNCSIGEDYLQLKNAICRVMVNSTDGSELCSGTLINNTAEDMKPYVISAAHCYDEWNLAETTIYTFGYESPYCAPLDGDPSHSISGAVMKASHDSLDFALVEMSVIPPPEYRPYYAGWSHSSILPDSTVSIHHPYGDIKKIALDYHPPVKSSFGNYKDYIANAFINVKHWEEGVTERGSSGGGLFNTKGQLIGTLTGGSAICGNPVNDFFASFDTYWDYRSDSTKQVKYWLDPIGRMASTLDGKQFYEDEFLCKAFTNLNDADEHANVRLIANGNNAGYWGGTNTVGIDEFVERFSIGGEESLKGVAFGVGKVVRKSVLPSEITVKVYNGNTLPESLIYNKTVSVGSLVEDAMNYISFDEDVKPAETFFVGFELSNVQAQDTFVLYQSLRNNEEDNHFYYRLNGEWQDFSEDAAMVNVMELIACNYGDNISDTPIVNTPAKVWIFPNPARNELTIQSDQDIVVETLSVYNLLGQEVNVPLLGVQSKQIKIDMSGNTPGIYVVRFNYNGSFVSRKFSLVPY